MTHEIESTWPSLIDTPVTRTCEAETLSSLCVAQSAADDEDFDDFDDDEFDDDFDDDFEEDFDDDFEEELDDDDDLDDDDFEEEGSDADEKTEGE